MRKLIFISCAFIISFVCNPWAWASSYATEVDGFTINHSIFPSLDLQPAMAQKFRIERKQNTALVVVTIVKTDELHSGTLPGKVKGFAKDLLSRITHLEFEHIEIEGESHYYIASVSYTSSETLVFNLEIDLEGKASPLKVKVVKFLG